MDEKHAEYPSEVHRIRLSDVPAAPAESQGVEAICAICDCGNTISMGPKGWVHEDSDQRSCERANPVVSQGVERAQPVEEPRETRKYPNQKHCCTVCAQKRRCSICDEQTTSACSDCAIDLRATVYVCSKKECQYAHAEKCPHELIGTIALAQAALEKANRELADVISRAHLEGERGSI